MDEAEQDQYEARLKELFDSFDSTGTGSLGQEELTDLCHMLHLEEVAPALQQTLLQGNLLGRVHFDQFKEALILILSRTLSNEEHFQETDCSPEAQPKYIKGGKRYGRRSLPEFQASEEDFAEVTVIEPLGEDTCPTHTCPSSGCQQAQHPNSPSLSPEQSCSSPGIISVALLWTLIISLPPTPSQEGLGDLGDIPAKAMVALLACPQGSAMPGSTCLAPAPNSQ